MVYWCVLAVILRTSKRGVTFRPRRPGKGKCKRPRQPIPLTEFNHIRRCIVKFITIDELPGLVPAKHFDLLSRTVADESIGSTSFRVGYTRMEKTGGCDPHIHENSEQLFIVLKGAMMFKSDQGEAPLKQGQAVLVNKGEVHSNYNIAEDETVYITVTSVPKG